MAPLTDGVFPVDSIATTWVAVTLKDVFSGIYKEQVLFPICMFEALQV